MLERALFRNSADSFLIGIGCESEFYLEPDLNWKALDNFLEQHNERTLFILVNYQLGLNILHVPHASGQLPLLRIWVPESTYLNYESETYLVEGKESEIHLQAAEQLFSTTGILPEICWNAQIGRPDYLERVNRIKNHIQLGDIYELNFCQSIRSQAVDLKSIQPFFHRMWEQNPTPFAGLAENNDWMLASASPERFIEKRGNILRSQPIKGTAPRGKTREEDRELIQSLQNSRKERAENIMIVDLVRNDLSRVAKKGTVQVDELCGIYSFPTVHQMISTVSCELKEESTFSDILQAAFPMGSMTGAPKKAAVELAEKYEGFPREFYSGSFGVIYPNGDFDLNVLIRSLVYDTKTQQISCGVGGAITILSDAEAEYEECRVKVGKILSLFGPCQW